MRRATTRLRPALALLLLAWVAQICLPVAHAAIMSSPRAQMLGWCGDPSRAAAIAAALPAEIREALEADSVSPDHLSDCARLCATGSAPPMMTVSVTEVLRAAGIEPAPASRPAPHPREQAPTPPAQGPPARA